MDFDSICKKTMELDSAIRFAGVINEKGRLVAGGMRKGLAPLESPKEDEMLFMELALRVRMRKEHDKQLGSVKFAMSYREKTILISFPLDDNNILYVSGETELDYKEIPSKILEIIRQSK